MNPAITTITRTRTPLGFTGIMRITLPIQMRDGRAAILEGPAGEVYRIKGEPADDFGMAAPACCCAGRSVDPMGRSRVICNQLRSVVLTAFPAAEPRTRAHAREPPASTRALE